jgi:hypothetical protein
MRGTGSRVTPADAACDRPPVSLLCQHLRDERVRYQCRAAAAPAVRGEHHRHVGVVGLAFGLEVARGPPWFQAALEAVAAERAAGRLREQRVHHPARGAAGLQDRVLLRAKAVPQDVLRGVHRQAEPFTAPEEHGLLGAHRGGLHRQCRLDPLVVRDQVAVAEREPVRHVVGFAVAARVVGEHPWHRAG